MVLVQVRKAGDLIVPKEILQALGIAPGSWVKASVVAQQIVLTLQERGETDDWSEEGPLLKTPLDPELEATAQMKLKESIEEVHR